MSTRYNDGSHYENHQRAAELEDIGAHAHRVAEQHADREHLTGHEHSRQTLEHSHDVHHGADAHRNEHGVATFGHQDIATLAYELWEARGGPHGSSEEDWFEAAKQLRARAEHKS